MSSLSHTRRSQTPGMQGRSPSPSLQLSMISNRSGSHSPPPPKPVREHDSHPISADHPQDMPGPGAYNPNTSSFDTPMAFRDVLRGPSLTGKTRELPPAGSDSPGPKYNTNESLRQDSVLGGSWGKQRRFVKNEVAPGCRNAHTPGPGEYNGTVSDGRTKPRVLGSLSFAPPLTVPRKRPEKMVDKSGAARAWKEKLKGIEAKERMQAGDDTFSVPVPRTKALVRIGPEKAPPCTFGRRLTDQIPVTPGPGAYEGLRAKVSTKEYSYMKNSGHGPFLKNLDKEISAAVGSYDPVPDAGRPNSPNAILFLTG